MRRVCSGGTGRKLQLQGYAGGWSRRTAQVFVSSANTTMCQHGVNRHSWWICCRLVAAWWVAAGLHPSRPQLPSGPWAHAIPLHRDTHVVRPSLRCLSLLLVSVPGFRDLLAGAALPGEG
jgi:hypothetical protein